MHYGTEKFFGRWDTAGQMQLKPVGTASRESEQCLIALKLLTCHSQVTLRLCNCFQNRSGSSKLDSFTVLFLDGSHHQVRYWLCGATVAIGTVCAHVMGVTAEGFSSSTNAQALTGVRRVLLLSSAWEANKNAGARRIHQFLDGGVSKGNWCMEHLRRIVTGLRGQLSDFELS
eukprot:EG_transcript_29867